MFYFFCGDDTEYVCGLEWFWRYVVCDVLVDNSWVADEYLWDILCWDYHRIAVDGVELLLDEVVGIFAWADAGMG